MHDLTLLMLQSQWKILIALEGLPQLPISLIFNDPCALLELFEYVSLSDYDLSFDLKDEMSELIGSELFTQLCKIMLIL